MSDQGRLAQIVAQRKQKFDPTPGLMPLPPYKPTKLRKLAAPKPMMPKPSVSKPPLADPGAYESATDVFRSLKGGGKGY